MRSAATHSAAKLVTTRALDQLCRAVVFARDGGLCRRCGKLTRGDGNPRQVQWCHVKSRRWIVIRWDLDNSMCLCASCHRWQHENGGDGERFFIEQIGQAAFDRLNMVLKTPRKTDRMAVRLYLEQKLREYTRLEGFD